MLPLSIQQGNKENHTWCEHKHLTLLKSNDLLTPILSPEFVLNHYNTIYSESMKALKVRKKKEKKSFSHILCIKDVYKQGYSKRKRASGTKKGDRRVKATGAITAKIVCKVNFYA